jgi:hypothetical protein
MAVQNLTLSSRQIQPTTKEILRQVEDAVRECSKLDPHEIAWQVQRISLECDVLLLHQARLLIRVLRGL